MEASTANAPAAGSEKLRKTALGVSDIVFFIVAASAPLTVDRGRGRLDLSGHRQRRRAAAVPRPRRDPRPVRHRLRGDEPPHHQRRRLLRLRLEGHRQGRGGGHRLPRADLLQLDADRDPRPVRRRLRRLHGRTHQPRLAVVHVGLRRDRRDRHPRLAARRPQRQGARDLPHGARSSSSPFFDLVVAGDPGPQGITRRRLRSLDRLRGRASAAALCFTMAAFVGFESAAIYGEECKEPAAHRRQGDLHRARDHLALLRALGLDAAGVGRART